jgi:hypothetical protein
MVLERQVTLLHAYLTNRSTPAMTASCPGCQQASCAYRCHKIAIRLYNCIQELGIFICSDSKLTITPNYLIVLSNQLIHMSFLGLNFSHIHDRRKLFIIMCAPILIVANDKIKMNLQNCYSFFLLIIHHMMNNKRVSSTFLLEIFSLFKAYFAKYQNSIYGPYYHIQGLQWIKLNIQVPSVEMNWCLI